MKHQILIEYDTDDILKLIAQDICNRELIHQSLSAIEDLVFQCLIFETDENTGLPSGKLKVDV